MALKVIAVHDRCQFVIREYTEEYCIEQINQWTEIYNYLEDLIDHTGNISYKLHWIKTRDYVGDVLSSWIYRINSLNK